MPSRAIIPLPLLDEAVDPPAFFELNPDVCIQYSHDTLKDAARLLQHHIQQQLGMCLALGPTTGCQGVQLALVDRLEELERHAQQKEGYTLRVDGAGVRIASPSPAGALYGCTTLLQLLPPLAPRADGAGCRIGARHVADAPRFPWRGLLLDVSRHFFPPPFIRRLLDLMALYKFNRFHWHLVDDQGWRLEIRQFPRLTEFGAWRTGQRGERYGGFYTQEEVREIVRYAAALGIEVVPEIEMPGHCVAALACYPHLSCTGAVSQVATQWGVHEDVFCAGEGAVFAFLSAVLGEVFDLFPSEFIHIGGDECPKARWQACAKCQAQMASAGLASEAQLQSWFLAQVDAEAIRPSGRRLLGWDEILEGGLVEGAAVMSWRGTAGGCYAAHAGHDVIMTPTSSCYFDYRQSGDEGEPGAWYSQLGLEAVYAFDPVPSELEPPLPAPGPAAPAAGGGEGPGSSEEQPGSAAAHAHAAAAADEEQRSLPGAMESPGRLSGGEGDPPDERPAGPRPPDAASHILGGQANLWTEYVSSEAEAEYMLLPRLAAMAEALWSPRGRRDWPGFCRRVERHEAAWRLRGLRYRPLGGAGGGGGGGGGGGPGDAAL